MKKTRARSFEQKQLVFKEIIYKGRELFLRFGVGGFTMRALANELDMGQASLYTYFKSKRELWFAIVEEDFKNSDNKIEELIKEYKGKSINLIEEIATVYFDSMKEDYRTFRLVFKTSPPKSSKKGPIEEQYQIKTITLLQEILLQAAQNGEIKERETTKLAYFFWSIIFGVALSTQTDSFGTIEKIPYFGTLAEYFDFVLRKIKVLVEALQKQ
ncbi:MAG: TetR/AcrR family transcriptional regulator [Asgard group archaeon]|nr:TetR/AcrR family transcriptional regulator [Asgard group archaeon]